MKYADLHLHTVFSDSTYTPEELVDQADKVSLSAIAVVDHDTVSGIAPVIQAAELKDIEVVPGIELTAEYENVEIHILGYFIDYNNPQMISRLETLKYNRVQRIYKIVDKLKEVGLKLDADSVFALSGPGTVGRLHVARAMVKEGLVGSVGEAFARYIGDEGPANYLGFKLSVQEAINLIKDAGGIAVLAHPYVINSRSIISKIIDYGIMGLEAYYPEHSAQGTKYYLDLAAQYGLLVTGGSDCHGAAKPEVKIGSIKVPYEIVEKLKAVKDRKE